MKSSAKKDSLLKKREKFIKKNLKKRKKNKILIRHRNANTFR